MTKHASWRLWRSSPLQISDGDLGAVAATLPRMHPGSSGGLWGICGRAQALQAIHEATLLGPGLTVSPSVPIAAFFR